MSDVIVIQEDNGTQVTVTQGTAVQATIQKLASTGPPAHNATTSRTAADAHPTSAITGLDAAMALKADAVNYTIQNGFAARAETTLSFSDATQFLAIAPVGASFTFWAGGVKYVYTVAKSVQVPDVEGIHYVYFNTDGILVTAAGVSQVALFADMATVAVVYWDATNKTAVLVEDERHERMPADVHKYLHDTMHCRWVSGLALGNIIAGASGDLDIHAQLSVADGVIRDEDIRYSITDGAPQELSTVAEIPLLYRSGASGVWRKLAATTFPVTTTGTGRAAWNQYTGGAWQLTEVTNLDYVLTHIVATTDINHPIVGVIGQNVYLTEAAAEHGAEIEISSLLLGDFATLVPEWKAVATVIFQSADNKDNAVKSSIELTAEGGTYIDWRISAVPAISVALAVVS